MWSRRDILRGAVGGALTLAGKPAFSGEPAASDVFDLQDITTDDTGGGAKRFVLATPKHLATGEKVPLVVLLHGLGETIDERLGVYAWIEKYGLASAYRRLRSPPVSRTTTRVDLTDARLLEVNAALGNAPFRGLAFVCPFTPNVNKAPNLGVALDTYARWIAETVLPRARAEAPVFADAAHTALDGCSLGGFVALEVFLRRPRVFGALGGIQSAIGESSAPTYAARLEKAQTAEGPKALRIATSSLDPFRAANVRLAAELAAKKIARELRVSPGPHDQPWLREVGTLEMLLFHDQRPR